jgi:hypothetical protein
MMLRIEIVFDGSKTLQRKGGRKVLEEEVAVVVVAERRADRLTLQPRA